MCPLIYSLSLGVAVFFCLRQSFSFFLCLRVLLSSFTILTFDNSLCLIGEIHNVRRCSQIFTVFTIDLHTIFTGSQIFFSPPLKLIVIVNQILSDLKFGKHILWRIFLRFLHCFFFLCLLSSSPLHPPWEGYSVSAGRFVDSISRSVVVSYSGVPVYLFN